MTETILAAGRPNIVITGGAGFIGSNLAAELVKKNNIIVIDNFITGNERNIDLLLQLSNFEFIKHDITDPIDLVNYPELKKFKIGIQGIQAVYHLACPTSPRDHEKLAIDILGATSYGTKNALDLALQYKAKFVHLSSQHVYGHWNSPKPIKETDIGALDPIGTNSAYDEGKRFSETLVSYYSRQFKLDAKIVRLFTTYGPKMAINDGRSVPDFIYSALNNDEIIIYGDENTENTFCYIADVVDALIKIEKTDLNIPINIGHYEKTKLSQVATMIIELTGSNSKITYQQPDWQLFSYNIPDIALAKQKLGWFPMMSLDQGLKATVEFMRTNLRLYQI